MSSKSAIEWTGHTWNPIVGCSILSPGCTNCYAMKMAARIEAMGNQPRYAGTTRKVNGNAVWTGKLAQAPDSTLLEPLKRKKPTVYFVNSMSDLFHENVPDEWIDRVFAVMALCPQHTFQVLTKRAKRMREYLTTEYRHEQVGDIMIEVGDIQPGFARVSWPLPNVWLGVSTERQQEADERIPELLETPAAVRFISAEPLLGPIDLLGTICRFQDGPQRRHCAVPLGCPLINWVIVGGESGLGARPMHPDWARALRDECAAAGVPFFFKQWGSWREPVEGEHFDTSQGRAGKPPAFIVSRDGTVHCFRSDVGQADRVVMIQVSKKAAGRHLDGVLHDDMPQRADGKGRG